MSSEFWVNIVENYTTYLTTISAAIAAIILFYKKGIKPLLQVLQKYNDMLDKVDQIFTEITPNDGKSIKDTIGKIDKKLTLVSERQWAMVTDNKHAVFEADPEGNFTRINRTYARMVQRTPEELMGHGWQNTIAQEERENLVQDWYKAAEEDREFSLNFNLETPNGKKIPARIRSYRMPDSEGNTLGYIGYVQRREESEDVK